MSGLKPCPVSTPVEEDGWTPEQDAACRLWGRRFTQAEALEALEAERIFWECLKGGTP
jgi:hypothetical protein